MESEQHRMVAEFMEIVGDSDGKARQFLQATNWQLDEAIQLYYAGDEIGNAGMADATWKDSMADSFSSQAPVEPPQNTSSTSDDYVRPPLPVRREALYEDIFQYRAHHMSQTSNQPSSIDAFRNFEDEAKLQIGSSEAANGVADMGLKKDSLAALYRPPFVLMYQGSFEQAKIEAARQGKWLLVNLQSTKEFSSYTLNRDTWAHEAVKDTIQTTFVFWQVYDDTEEGRKVCTYYKLTGMPTTMVLDPITGQKMRSWEGMVGAERLLEDLVPYMDKGPMEQKQLSFPPQKRPRESTYVSTDIAEGRSGWDEEEELRQALAASLEDTREPAKDNAPVLSSSEKGKVCAQVQLPNEDAHLQGTPDRAYPPLPKEPASGTTMVCRVAVRFPDGRRGQRRFLLSDPIQLLWSFCCSMLKEAAEGRPFHLTHTIPGMVGGILTFETQSSIADAGVANSMLALTWD